MSRTKPNEYADNPVEHKLEWVGHEAGGYFTVWDREAKQEIKLELPLRFAYLDTKKAVGGYYESVKRSFFSNEIRNTKTQEFDVRYYKDGNTHPVAKGLWADIKGDIGNKGAKFCNVVYATLLTSTNEDVPGGSLVKLPLVGAAGSAWIDLGIKDGESFEVTGYDDRTKGRTKYRSPVFEKIEIDDDEDAIACDQDKALQEYFNAKREPKKDTAEGALESGGFVEDDEELIPLDDDVPF